MKQTKTFVTALVFFIGVVGAFAFKPSKLNLYPRANDGSCTPAVLNNPGTGHFCRREATGTFCSVTISGTAYNAYDGSCTVNNEIKYN